MALAVASSTSDTTSNGTVSLASPSGTSVGDFLLVFWFSDDESVSTPAGWTLSDTLTPTTGSSAGYCRVYSKVAVSGDTTGTIFTATDTNAREKAFCYRITDSQNTLTAGTQNGNLNLSLTKSFSISLTVPDDDEVVDDSLVFMYLTDNGEGAGFSGASSVSATGPTTGTVTIEFADSVGTDTGYLLAYTKTSDGTDITGFSATVTGNRMEDTDANMLIISSGQNGEGTFTAIGATTSVDVDVSSAANPFFTAINSTATAGEISTTSSEPTIWTNETKPSTSWDNENKL